MYKAEMKIKNTEAALAVARDSERLLILLKFSISSRTLVRDLGFDGLVSYLRATKRTLRVRLIFFAIRVMWLRISKIIGRSR